MMGRFINGVVVGAAIGLLIAPLRGDEMRRLVRERLDKLGGTLPGSTTREQPVPEALSEVKENVRESMAKPGAKLMGETKPGATNT